MSHSVRSETQCKGADAALAVEVRGATALAVQMA